jgi:hypothetical protein
MSKSFFKKLENFKTDCLVGVNNQLKKDSYDHPTAAYKILLNNHFINPLSVESGCKYNRRKVKLPNIFERKVE